jgi:hypothetical protein
MVALGWRFLNGNGVPKSIRSGLHWYRRAAELNAASAHYSLGQHWFAKGQYSRAIDHFLDGAELRHPRCLYCLGRIQLLGLGWKQDVDGAAVALRVAARHGSTHAARLLSSKQFERIAARAKK